MRYVLRFEPGAVAQGQQINLPTYAPKIDQIVSARILRPTSLLSVSGTALQGADLAATQADHAAAARHSLTAGNPVVAATATRVDEDTIALDVATQAGDTLELVYIPVGMLPKAA